MGKRLCNDDFSLLPVPLVSNVYVKDQYKPPKNLLVGGQCLDRLIFCHLILMISV